MLVATYLFKGDVCCLAAELCGCRAVTTTVIRVARDPYHHRGAILNKNSGHVETMPSEMDSSKKHTNSRNPLYTYTLICRILRGIVWKPS